MGYCGLPRETLAFMAGLRANNTREWFEAHRPEYDRYWLAVGLDLAAALAGPVSALGLGVEPKLNASLRRIHRDTRFSADKRPYEPRLHLIFTATRAFNKEAGVHLVIGPEGLGYGAGIYAFAPDALERYRAAVLDPAARAALQAALAAVAPLGCDLDAPELVRLPKGLVAAPDWEHLLRRKSVILRTQVDRPLPDWLFTAEAVPQLTAIIAAHMPLMRWLSAL